MDYWDWYTIGEVALSVLKVIGLILISPFILIGLIVYGIYKFFAWIIDNWGYKIGNFFKFLLKVIISPVLLIGWLIKWTFKIIRGLLLLITKPLRDLGNYKG